jgi:hypothetical protein
MQQSGALQFEASPEQKIHENLSWKKPITKKSQPSGSSGKSVCLASTKCEALSSKQNYKSKSLPECVLNVKGLNSLFKKQR